MAEKLESRYARVFLKNGRDRPVRGGNPWIFSQAIERTEPDRIEAGTPVEVISADQTLIGLGYLNLSTTIAIRMLWWRGSKSAPTPSISELAARRLSNALDLRRSFVGDDTDSYRVVNGDGDGLSGVVADRYGDVIVVQLLTAGADRMRETIAAELGRLANPRAILERSSGAVRRQEGLEDSVATIAGEPVASTVATEGGIKVKVDFEHGQKTGYFLDQRENRARVRSIAKGARVLDAYCYGGGFSLAAIAGGAARVTAIDTSERAIGWARENLALNGHRPDAAELIHADAARYMAETPERFDLIVLDPPPLARSRADAERAGRLYVELNSLAMQALAPRGRLMTFSCSAHFGGEDFIRAARFAQGRASRNLRILAHLGPGSDHPVLLGHAEGEYLTGLLLGEL
ncbi:MAG TPA: class I SAM-dependent rRNA methyltransferase [Candidatus Binataceae bacterium]|nr:class I SAM-dependent rRNA methyltransferase [Candidatus Binataceae bacterium]